MNLHFKSQQNYLTNEFNFYYRIYSLAEVNRKALLKYSLENAITSGGKLFDRDSLINVIANKLTYRSEKSKKASKV